MERREVHRFLRFFMKQSVNFARIKKVLYDIKIFLYKELFYNYMEEFLNKQKNEAKTGDFIAALLCIW